MVILISKQLTFSSCKKLALARLREAKVLHKSRKYSGAYYLAGYAIELGIKAFYCKSIKKYTFPPNRSVIESLYKHDLNELMKVSGLKIEFDKDSENNNLLLSSWAILKDWGAKDRYLQFRKLESESMINSIEVILKWIQTKWK